MTSLSGETPTSICEGCGICCNGVLYERAKVAPGEEQRMKATGLELFEDHEKKFFRQPCPHSSNGRCSIYATRFTICRTFECALLKRVRRGEVSLPDAWQTVVTALELVDKVVVADPDARTARGRIAVRAKLAEECDCSERSRRLLNIVALDSFLHRWFRHESEKRKTPDEQVMKEPIPRRT